MGKYKDALIELESVDLELTDRYALKKVFEFETKSEELHSLVNYSSHAATKAHIKHCTEKMEYAFGIDSYTYWSSLRNSIMNAFTLRNFARAEQEAVEIQLEAEFKVKYDINAEEE